MLGLNNVQIIGNLGGTPEMKYLNNSDHVVNFREKGRIFTHGEESQLGDDPDSGRAGNLAVPGRPTPPVSPEFPGGEEHGDRCSCRSMGMVGHRQRPFPATHFPILLLEPAV